MAAVVCKGCKKFQKKNVVMDERQFCPACAEANPITKSEIVIANEPDAINIAAATIENPGTELAGVPELVEGSEVGGREEYNAEGTEVLAGTEMVNDESERKIEDGGGTGAAPVVEGERNEGAPVDESPKLVVGGKRGVTNAQMIPVIRQMLAENNVDGLKALKATFPNVFESSRKYIGFQRQADLAKIIPVSA